MKKNLIFLAIALLSVSIFVIGFADAKSAATVNAGDEIGIFVDGEKLVFDVPPVSSEQRVLAPMRKVLESLGYNVDWDPVSMTVTAVYSENMEIVHVIGTDQVSANGQVMTLDVASFAVEGRTMVPLRFFSEILGYDVRWQGSENAAYISTAPAISYNQEKYAPAYYFPLNQGNSWDLSNGGLEDAGYTVKILMASDPYYQAWSEVPGMSQDVIVYEQQPDAIKIIFSEMQAGIDESWPMSYWAEVDLVNQDGFTSNKEEIVLKAPVDAGTAWSYADTDCRIVAVDQTVETPAGVFEGCVKVERISAGSEMVVYECYAPGIGPVSREYLIDGLPSFEPSLLEAYTVNDTE